jgi:hypothetical protein
LLRDEGSGCLINVDDHEYGVEFVALDSFDVDRSTVSSVALIMGMGRAIAKGGLVGSVARAARCATVRRAMGFVGIESFGGRMMVRWACRFRVAEAGLGT